MVSLATGQTTPHPSTTRDISELAPEDLMKLKVTSAWNKEQALSKVGAAIYVITREDIASSGANNIPDLLRLVPGVEVARINSSQWAISIRGFNSLFSNKVLALIDGRALYQPSFSTVLWDQQDVPLEDIERIEVIRGPGGTIWGANAVNGVINIITRHARDTQGGLVAASSGSHRIGDGLIQYGGKAGSEGAYRAYAKYLDVGSSEFSDGQWAGDAWHSWAGGVRSDWNLTERDAVSFQGDWRETVAGGSSLGIFSEPQLLQASVNSPIRNQLGNVMGTWRHTLAGGSETTLRVYFDHMRREGEAGADISNDTVDADFEHHLGLGRRNDVVWGLNLRVHTDDIRARDSHSLQVIPEHSTIPFVSGFFQDEIRVSKSLFLPLGSKLEHNDYTGLEYEPSAQLVWSPSDRHTLWTSVARTIRQPNRLDFGSRLNLGITAIHGIPALLKLFGNHNVEAEDLRDYEAGYRSQLRPGLSLDFAAFLSYYRNLETSEPGTPGLSITPGGTPYFVIPVTFANLAHARDYGAEAFIRWTPARRWTLSPGYSFVQMSIQPDAGSRDTVIASSAGLSARHHFQIKSLFRLASNVEWSATVRYVSQLSTPHIAAYTGVDTTLQWRPRDDFEVSLTGQNLLRPGRLEFADVTNILIPSQVQRSVFGKWTWRF